MDRSSRLILLNVKPGGNTQPVELDLPVGTLDGRVCGASDHALSFGSDFTVFSPILEPRIILLLAPVARGVGASEDKAARILDRCRSLEVLRSVAFRPEKLRWLRFAPTRHVSAQSVSRPHFQNRSPRLS